MKFKKKFKTPERAINDLEGRVVMPEFSIPKIYEYNMNYAVLEKLKKDYSFSKRENIFDFFYFLWRIHKYMIDFFVDEFSEADIKYNHKVNERCEKILKIPLTPIKIGDLKPEHVMFDFNDEIKICDYETAGFGYVFEDLIWILYAVNKSNIHHWYDALNYYSKLRFGKIVNEKKFIKCLVLTYLSLLKTQPELNSTRWIIRDFYKFSVFN
ncbi:hypothetical protein CBF23_005965 [Marinomonas agarivorans]|nr:hypothetical protein CBF23_005965 [Marinomonas agarivorans]